SFAVSARGHLTSSTACCMVKAMHIYATHCFRNSCLQTSVSRASLTSKQQVWRWCITQVWMAPIRTETCAKHCSFCTKACPCMIGL
ncbi:unnamed protein product, partial [Symbiodinium necroappetens]